MVATLIQGPGRPALTPFGAYISKEVTDSTLASWTQGKPHMYPSSVSLLAAKGAFGGISLAHSFLKTPVFQNVAIHIIKSYYLDTTSLRSLLAIIPSSMTL